MRGSESVNLAAPRGGAICTGIRIEFDIRDSISRRQTELEKRGEITNYKLEASHQHARIFALGCKDVVKENVWSQSGEREKKQDGRTDEFQMNMSGKNYITGVGSQVKCKTELLMSNMMFDSAALDCHGHHRHQMQRPGQDHDLSMASSVRDFHCSYAIFDPYIIYLLGHDDFDPLPFAVQYDWGVYSLPLAAHQASRLYHHIQAK